jgi:hypothetical protein
MSNLLDTTAPEPAVIATATTTSPAPAATATRPRMSWGRRTALAGGVAYLLTFLFSLPTLVMKGPLDNPGFVLGLGSQSSVVWACVFDVLTAFAGIATAVALYPVIRRQSERCSLGFVASRVLEATILVVGAMSLLAVVTMRQDAASVPGGPDALVSISHAFVAVHDWAFLFGPGVMSPINALLLGTVMYRSRLVPRLIPAMGLVGAPFALASALATVFGLWDQVSAPAAVAVLPVALWELSLGLWLTFKGFRPSPLTDEPMATTAHGHAAA